MKKNVRGMRLCRQWIAQNLTIWREMAGLSVEEFADRLSMVRPVTKEMVQDWEEGKKDIPAGYMGEIAIIFHTNVENFFPPISIYRLMMEKEDE